MIRGQLFHICLLFFNYVKEMFRENRQNINIWTDMAYLANLKISLSLATLVTTFLICFFIMFMQHGIVQLQVMERGLRLVLEAP